MNNQKLDILLSIAALGLALWVYGYTYRTFVYAQEVNKYLLTNKSR